MNSVAERLTRTAKINSCKSDSKLMKFLGLISGGKDSFYNIHHCLTQGHELIALGNLYPAEVDELDSFMFQTVGHDIIESYSQCLSVPLYRQVIKGNSKNQDLEYVKTANDEIEDLCLLIQTIVTKHPDVQAVSCGAILSHYQRTRVEHICDRFGLTSLTFLWQRDQKQLMQEMCDSGLDARIVKVAAIGLSSKHLGKSITELYPYLIKLNQMYDVHICGEGGEFETIVLDCNFFRTKRLEFEQTEVVEVSGDVSYLKSKVKVVDKLNEEFVPVNVPELLDEPFSEINEPFTEPSEPINEVIQSSSYTIKPMVVTIGNNLVISNLTDNSPTIKMQMNNIFTQLEEILNDHNLTFNDIQHVNLLLSDMNKFSEINQLYESKFAKNYLPPSRACIEANISTLAQLSCKCILKETTTKKGIHIRSRSYWAPQNIGPYSQARVEEQLHINVASISGQIPLIPSSMELSKSDISAVLSLQHFHRIKKLINIGEISYMICFITKDADLNQVKQVWLNYCEMIETQDILTKLIIVMVSALPKNASVEWAGETYRKIEDLIEEEDDIEKVACEPILNKLEHMFSNLIITNLKHSTVLVMFTDCSDQINKLFEALIGSTYTIKISCAVEDFESIKYEFEYLPVFNVYNYQREFKYGVILTLENNYN